MTATTLFRKRIIPYMEWRCKELLSEADCMAINGNILTKTCRLFILLLKDAGIKLTVGRDPYRSVMQAVQRAGAAFGHLMDTGTKTALPFMCLSVSPVIVPDTFIVGNVRHGTGGITEPFGKNRWRKEKEQCRRSRKPAL